MPKDTAGSHVRLEDIKLMEASIGRTRFDISHSNIFFLAPSPKVRVSHASDIKDFSCIAGLIPGSGRSPGDGRATPPVFFPGKSHGQRSLVGYSSWDHKELDMTKATEHACNPIMKAPPSRSNHLPNASPPLIITLRVRILTCELWGDTNIQSINIQNCHARG